MQQRVLVVLALAGWMAASFFAGLYIASRPMTSTSRSAALSAGEQYRVVNISAAAAEPRLALVGVDSLETLVDRISAAYKRPVQAHWNSMSVTRGSPIRFDLPEADLDTAIRIVNGTVSAFDRIDYRVYPDHIELASMQHFDRSEITAVNHDIADLLRTMSSAAPPGTPPTQTELVRRVIDTIQDTVEPESWQDYGGDLGRITVIGSGLIISCPKRLHPQVEWVLKQMRGSPGWNTGLVKLLNSGATGGAAAAPPTLPAGGTPTPPVTPAANPP